MSASPSRNGHPTWAAVQADVREVCLRLVRPVQSRARRAPFVVVVLTVLSLGLVGLIVGSTVLQSQAFEQAALDREIADLQTQQQALSSEVDRLLSPGTVADRAASLGMVRNTNPAFLRLTDGKVLGSPAPAEKGN